MISQHVELKLDQEKGITGWVTVINVIMRSIHWILTPSQWCT